MIDNKFYVKGGIFGGNGRCAGQSCIDLVSESRIVEG